jgi:hypothetical protein
VRTKRTGAHLRAAATTPYPKDGINDHVVAGAETVDPSMEGTKAALWYVADVAPGATVEFHLRLRVTTPARRAEGHLGGRGTPTTIVYERQSGSR